MDLLQVWFTELRKIMGGSGARNQEDTELTFLRSREKEMGVAELRDQEGESPENTGGEVARHVRQLLTERALRTQTQSH